MSIQDLMRELRVLQTEKVAMIADLRRIHISALNQGMKDLANALKGMADREEYHNKLINGYLSNMQIQTQTKSWSDIVLELRENENLRYDVPTQLKINKAYEVIVMKGASVESAEKYLLNLARQYNVL